MARRKSRGNGIIRGRRCPKIQNCPTCGQMRIYHPDNALFVCPVPAEVTAAIRAFKNANGKLWKSRLRWTWETGNYLRWAAGESVELLQQARNTIGPRRLDKITL